MKKYNVNYIRHDLDGYPNISMSSDEVRDAVVYDCQEYNGEFVSDSRLFGKKEDAVMFVREQKTSTLWLGQNTDSRGTIRVIAYTIEEVRYDDDGDVDTFCEIARKFEPFEGYYKTGEEFWKDGNK